MSSADEWIAKSQIGNSIRATDAEASSALSFVCFKWTVNLARAMTGFLRGVRPQRSIRQPDKPERSRNKGKERERDRDDVGTRSMPVVTLSRQKSIAIGAHEREKHRQKRKQVVQSGDHQISVDISQAEWRHSSHHVKSSQPTASGSRVEGSGSKPRRGSAPTNPPSMLDMLSVPPPSSRIASPQPKHPSKSPQITTPSSPSSPV